ncbi:MAG: hypothetical protein PF484_07990 [Bacteroidales bacterium]|jgi:hypothetical protein|nr:hypothetical protein [Bacteroidales bacterium]
MKKTIFTLIAFFTLSLINPLSAQQSDKDLTRSIRKNAVREARKQARKYKRDDYYVALGALPMDKQLEQAWKYQLMTEDDGFPSYIVATGNSVAETQIAAKLQATEVAKLELAGTIATNVAALIETNIANQQLNTEEAASVTKTVAAAKNIIAQRIGRVITMVEMYKKIGSNVEANVRLAYNSQMANEIAKKVIRKELEEQTDLMQDKLEKLMDFK